MKSLLKASTAIAMLSVLVLGFQNCSGKDFSSSKATNNSGNAGFNAGSGSLSSDQFEPGVTSEGDLVQIQGNFNSNGGAIDIEGEVSNVNIQALDNSGQSMTFDLTSNEDGSGYTGSVSNTDNSAGANDGSNGSANDGSGQPIIIIDQDNNDQQAQNDDTQDANGRFRLCVKLNQPGDQQLQLLQQNALDELFKLLIPSFTTQMAVQDMVFEFTDMEVMSASSGKITIQCIPGATISSEIYGSAQLGSGMACKPDGTLTFNVGLVPSFANSGNRVVVVTQTLENGAVSTISADIDNTVSVHQCSITSGIANIDICVDSAGTVSGNCKAGLPVKLSVDGQLQEVVTCKQNGQFEVTNVLLPNGSEMHEIKIEQDSPFEVNCSDSVMVQKIVDLNN